jgi:hypothetical protein
MDRQWQTSGVLSGAALDNLYALNREYLEVLARSRPRRPQRRAVRSLPQQIAVAVSQLTPPRRLALAQSPFSLFDAHFIDGTFWSQLTTTVHEPLVATVCDCPITRFTHAVLFFAWHLTRADPLAGRLLLGMSCRTQSVFEPLTLMDLQQLAARHPSLVTPRWHDRDTVWRILLGASRRGAAHMAETRMYGIQLIAGDLSASTT